MTTPNETAYDVEDQQLIVKTPDVWVQILTLGSGQKTPWHSHTAVTDTLICLDGPMVVKTLDVAKGRLLQAGETFAVPPKTPHQVLGKDGGPCRFLIVQGVGKYDFVPYDAPS